MKKNILLPALLLILSLLPAQATLTQESLFEQSHLWPYHVKLTEPQQNLKAGTRAVLIRMDSPETALLDFGRHGQFTVPTAATSLLEDAQGIQSGTIEKDYPNYFMIIGPRLVDPKLVPVDKYSFDEVKTHDFFITIYVNDNLDTLLALAEGINEHKSLFAEKAVLPFIIPQSNSHDFDYAEKLRACDLKIPFMYQHLSKPYTKSLAHAPTEEPLLVLVDKNGKILARADTGNITEKIATINEALHGIQTHQP